MAWATGATVVVPIYPLATKGGTAGQVVPQVAQLISNEVTNHPNGGVSVYGAGDLDPKDPLASPLYGSLDGLPPTYVYAGSLDVLAPDAVALKQKAEQTNAPITFVLRKGLIHDWAMVPITPEGIAVLPNIYRNLVGCSLFSPFACTFL
ncbi:alpha/beta hydrolase [Mycolicibacterium pulveris]|nr:alpha/beta hydrolase fold domain-containing protein [Mycolicibacterium pulveris]